MTLATTTEATSGYVLPQIPAAAQRSGFKVPGWNKPLPFP